MVPFAELTTLAQLDAIQQQSYTKPQIIFKHSTTCSISATALNRFTKSDEIASGDYYLLDLRKHRDVSNEIAAAFAVQHESPQVIVIKDGKAIYNDSHFSIDMDDVIKAAGV